MTISGKRLPKSQQTALIALIGEDLTFHGDGTVTKKQSYYYRAGRSAEILADAIMKMLPTAEIVDKGDKWAPWPKDSYFWVRFRLNMRATR